MCIALKLLYHIQRVLIRFLLWENKRFLEKDRCGSCVSFASVSVFIIYQFSNSLFFFYFSTPSIVSSLHFVGKFHLYQACHVIVCSREVMQFSDEIVNQSNNKFRTLNYSNQKVQQCFHRMSHGLPTLARKYNGGNCCSIRGNRPPLEGSTMDRKHRYNSENQTIPQKNVS